MTLYVCPSCGIVMETHARKTLVQTINPWFTCKCGFRLEILGNGYRWWGT